MFSLTHRERKVLLFIAALIFTGSILRFFHLCGKEAVPGEVISSPLNVNVNVASWEELKSLPGIGAAIAGRIIAYRLKHGQFQDLEDLKKVKGIGDKKADLLNKHVTFGR